MTDVFQDITSLARLSHCMKLDKHICDMIERDKYRNLWEQIRELTAAWLDRHIEEPSWEEIVRILVCMKKLGYAKQIADKTGVDFERVRQEG